ncbi:MAG: hypothetical protein K6C36_06145 [Clostridia bacterium]|nr:hypothetical protein [Clostridia bacterium]
MSVLVVGAGNDGLIGALERLGHTVVTVEPFAGLDPRIGSHADLYVCSPQPGVAVIAPCQYRAAAELRKLGVETVFADCDPVSPYPGDVRLNALVSGRRIFGKTSALDPQLLNFFSSGDRIDIRQGYCRCSAVAVAENAFITDDASAARAMRDNGAEVLELEKGCVRLPGFDHGFFAGATGMLDRRTLGFNGSLEKSPFYARVESFCRVYGVSAVSLSEEELSDVGSVIAVSY